MADEKLTCGQKFGKFWREVVYDGRRGTLFDRTASSWAKITVFYIIFYALLAGFFGIWIAVYLESLDAYQPRFSGEGSIIGTNPGLGFVPHADVDKNLLWFNTAKPYTYKPYVDNMIKFLAAYDSVAQPESTMVKCRGNEPPPEGKVCRFEAKQEFESLEDCRQEREFGFKDGKPCVVLKMNKMYGWTPESYESEEEVPEVARPLYDPDLITVTCEGMNAADKENIGPVQYSQGKDSGKSGFPRVFFPYRNVDYYIQPLVMVQFENPAKGVLINVECRFWVPNISHDRTIKQGLAVFELMVD